MIDFSIPLAGLGVAETQLNTAATRIASIGGSPEGDSVDLSAEVVALLQAKNSFAASTKALKTEEQMTQSLFSILG